MNKYISLLEDLGQLALLIKLRYRKNNIKQHTVKEESPIYLSPIHEDNDEDTNYETDSINSISNESYFEISANKDSDKQTHFITTYRFNKKTKQLEKTLIPDDSKNSDNIKNYTQGVLNRKVVCEFCGKFLSEKHLKFHMNKHKNHYPFKCNIDNCKRAFTSQQMLRQHQQFHSKIKRFKCEFCDQGFYIQSSLKNHRLLHFDPDIQCDKCDKKLHTISALRSHNEKVHLGIKKFTCKFCDVRYTNKSSLRKHLASKHNQTFVSQRITK